MKQTVNFTDFIQAFHKYDRFEQFSYEAYQALFEFYEELEQDTGEELELDVIAICCDWTEETEQEVRDNYSIDSDTDVEEYLQDNTICYKLDNGNFLYLSF